MRRGRGQIWPELINGVADVTGLTNLSERSSVVLKQNRPHRRSCLSGSGPRRGGQPAGFLRNALHCRDSHQRRNLKDAAILPGYGTLNRAWLASTLLVLRGFTRHLCVACSSYSWNIVAGHQERTSHVFQQQLREEGPDAAVYKSKRDLPRFQGNLLDFHLTLLTNKDARTDEVSLEDAGWIHQHFDVFNNLAAQSQPFRFALEAAIDWRFAKDARSAVARLWSGIEAIFGITSELVYRISLLSACLLAERGDTRKAKFEQVKKLYGLRSKVVHGEQLTDKERSRG